MLHSRKFLLVDSDPLKYGKSWRGVSILAPSILSNLDWKNCNLVISSYGSQNAIIEAAKGYGVPNERILGLYDEQQVY